jgi:hypothetical protein
MWLAHAAGALRSVADRLLVVRRLMRRFPFTTLHNIALMLDREWVGREASPTAGVLDSQTVKSPHARAVVDTMPPRAAKVVSATS